MSYMGTVSRRTRILVLLALAVLVLATAAFAAAPRVPVTLRVVGLSDLNVGQAARLTATAKLPAGAHLLIQALQGRTPAKVAECLRSPCTGSFRHNAEEGVAFQASVIKRAGRRVTTLVRSKQVSVFWREPTAPLPPPPPPPPAATPGHFSGTIGNAAANIQFDITSDGISMTNWVTGEIDESCDPSNYTFWFTGIHGSGPYPVATDGTFTIASSGGDSSLTYTIKFTGKVTGASASGILHVESSYLLSDGNRLNCSSGDQPWTATKSG
jgi:hypothetical protein